MIEWQTVSVPLVGGLDTKTDEKAVLPTRLTKLENGEFTKGGSVRKRTGYTAILPRLSDGTPLEGLSGLCTRENGLAVTNDSTLYSYDNLRATWVEAGAYVPMTYTGQEVAFTSSEQTVLDSASVADIAVYAWQDSRGGVRCAVYNSTTGAAYSPDTVVQSTNAQRPRCVIVDSNVLIFFVDTGTNAIKCKVIRAADVASSLTTTPVLVISDLGASRVYDACSGGSTAYVVYTTDGSVVVGNRVCMVNSGGTASGHTTVDGTNANIVAATYDPVGDHLFLGCVRAASVFFYQHSGTTLAAQSSTSTLEADVTQLTMAPNSSGGVTAIWENLGSTPSDYNIDVTDVFGGTLTLTTYLHSGLASKAFLVGDHVFCHVAHESRTGIQHNVYLFRADGVWAGRILSEGVGILTSGHLPSVTETPDATFLVALNFKRKLKIQDTGPVETFAQYEHKGIKGVVLNPAARPYAAEVGRTAYLSGSQLWAFDGGAPIEAGFHMFPDMLTSDITLTGTADADIPGSGVFSYRVYYEYTMANGERFRSAAIARVSPTLNGNRVQLEIPTLAHTQMTGARGEVSIVVYRTEQDAGQLYYRASSSNPTVTGVNGYIANDPTVASVTWTDGMSDAVLITNELDYLSQGLMANFAPEGPEYVAAAQGRLFLVGGGQRPNNVRFSKLHFDGEPCEFSDPLIVEDAPELGGKTMAVSAMGTAVVVFKERAIYALDNGGPDNTNLNGYYSVRQISTELGCVAPGSVVSYTDGVCFQSAEGLYLLDQGFNLNYLGAEVEAYNAQTCVAATMVPDTSQLVFLMSDGVTLMYDTFYRQWSTFTNHLGLAAAVWKGTTYTYLRSDGKVYVQATGLYTDNGVGYPLVIRTAPMRIEESLQQFWRARKLSILGEYKSSHRLRVSVYYNRDEAPFYTFEIEPDDILELGTWGSEATWGATGTMWGGSLGSREYQFQHRFKRQKCQTLRLEFEDLSTGTVPGPSFELTELAMEVGTRTGLGRIPASRKI